MSPIERMSSREVYRNSWMTVREDAIRRPDGSHGIYGVIDKPTYALVVARDTALRAREWNAHDGAELRRRYEDAIAPHFAVEEELLVPALRRAGELVLAARIVADHAELRALVKCAAAGDGAAAAQLAVRLRAHVRFEERTVFGVCEAKLEGWVLEEVARRAPK